MTRIHLALFLLAALLLSACSKAQTEQALSQPEAEPSGEEAVSSNQALTASPLTLETYGIARWEAHVSGDAAAVIGLTEAGERVFAFEFASREGERGAGLQIINREMLTSREVEITDAYFDDVAQHAVLNPSSEDLTFKGGGPGCDICGGAPVKFSCYAVVLMCQDRQWCPSTEGLSNWVEKNCGNPYACGACLGFDW